MPSAASARAASSSADPRYPIGKFERPPAPGPVFAQDARTSHLEILRNLPATLRSAVEHLSPAQLDTPYREGGWTVRQLVHHVADSHLNAYSRVRLALTEDWPTIKPYDEALWAELPDARTGDIAASLSLLAALHHRWVALFESLNEDQWHRGYRHPQMGEQPLPEVLALYAWHCRHHLAHVTAVRARLGW